MTAPTHRCESCGTRHHLAALTEIIPAIWMCHTCHAHPPLADTPEQWAPDWRRDGMHICEATRPLSVTTRYQLMEWQHIRQQQKHGGATW